MWLHLHEHQLMDEVSAKSLSFTHSPFLSAPIMSSRALPCASSFCPPAQLLTAMAKVHVTVLEEMMQKLWIKQQPLLLLTG